jgi:DNA-binding CsgD family transcriptional regulator
VVVARPVEGEADLPLAVMTDVLRPLTGCLDALLPEYRDVLATAAGGAGRASTDRLLLAAATLAVLAAAAEEAPTLLVIDDAHWVDPASAQALSFAVRRLFADRIAVVTTRRAGEDDRIDGPWTIVPLDGLTSDDVAEMLRTSAGMPAAATVVRRVLDETRGNPLAVSHLAARLPAAAVAGTAPLPMTLPLREVAQRTFSGLVRGLPDRTRIALAVVAAAGSAAAQLASDALSALGLSGADLIAAEDAGLLGGSSGQLEFEHPLYRAAALEVAGAATVRRAHAALSEVARGSDPQRHAWHLGLSVLGTDEEAARVLDEAASAAEDRVGAAASLGLRTAAVALSPLGAARDRRELAAVRALVAAGHHAEARSRLQTLLERDGVAADIRADAFHQEARLMLWDTPLDSQPVAERIPDDLPPRQMAATLAVAALRARNCAELHRYGDLARSAHAQVASLVPDQASEIAETLVLLPTLSLVAESDLVLGAHTAPSVREAVGRVQRLLAASRGGEPVASEVRRGLTAMLDELSGSPAQMLTWTDRLDLAGDLLAVWLAAAARARPASVAYLLMARTELCGWTGDLRGGIGAAGRAIDLSREVGSHALTGWTHAFAARLHAALGDERGCLAHGEAATELGGRLSEPGPAVWSLHARAQLLLGLGRPEEAVEVLGPAADYAGAIGFHGIRAIPWQIDYIEGLARTGRTGDAEAVFVSWLDSLPPDADAWHRAMAARCRVLVQGEEAVDELIALLDAGALRLTPLEEARSRLIAGGALRRRRRPSASQAMIRQAEQAFARLGAAGWRAAAEADLSERRRPGNGADAGLDGLTSQEVRVAQEIASGATTREAAARLFCSPKTVEYHLTRVYTKLGVRGRAALAARVGPGTRAAC